MNGFQFPEDKEERVDLIEESLGGLSFEEEEDEHQDERWLVSYADMMTLLFGLFVLLFSMSVMDKDKAQSILKSTEEQFGKNSSAAVEESLEAPSEDKEESSEIAALKAEIETLNVQMEKIKRERDDLILENDTVFAQKEEEEAPAPTDDRELRRLSLALKKSKTREAQLEKQLTQMSQLQQAEPASDPSDDLKDQVKDLEKQLASASSMTRQKMSKFKSYLIKLRDSRRDLLKKNKMLSQRNQSLQRDFEQARTQLAQAEALKSKMNTIQRKLASAQGLSKQTEKMKAALSQSQTDRLRVSQQLEKMMIDNEVAKKKLSESERTISSLQQELQKSGDQLKKVTSQVNDLKNSKSFLAFMIEWPSKDHDIDLTITDPQGRKYTYKNRQVQGHPGKFVVDTKRGPGVEFWQSSKLIPGRYKASYYFFNQYGNVSQASVGATIFSPKGTVEIPSVKMDLTTSRKHEVVFDVSSTGAVKLVSP